MIQSESDAFHLICHKPHLFCTIPPQYRSRRIWVKIIKKRPQELEHCKDQSIIEKLAPSALSRYGMLWFSLQKPGHLLQYAVKNIPSLINQGTCIFARHLRARGDITKEMIEYVRERDCHVSKEFIERELLISCLLLEREINCIIENYLTSLEDDTFIDINAELDDAYSSFLKVEGSSLEIILDIFNMTLEKIRATPTNIIGQYVPFRQSEIDENVANWKPKILNKK